MVQGSVASEIYGLQQRVTEGRNSAVRDREDFLSALLAT